MWRKMEKRDGDTRVDGVADLGAPAGIAVGGKTTEAVWRRRDGIIVCLGVRRIRMMEVGVKGLATTGSEVDAHVVG